MRLSGLITFNFVLLAIAKPLEKRSLALEQRDKAELLSTDLSQAYRIVTRGEQKKKKQKKKHHKDHQDTANHINESKQSGGGCSGWSCLIPPRRRPENDLVTGSFDIALLPFDGAQETGYRNSHDRRFSYQWGPGPVTGTEPNSGPSGIRITIHHGPSYPWGVDSLEGTGQVINGDNTVYRWSDEGTNSFVVSNDDINDAAQKATRLDPTGFKIIIRVNWSYHDEELKKKKKKLEA